MAFIGLPFSQEIYFDNGTTRIFRNVVRIEIGNMVHLETSDGYEYIINPSRILFIRKWKKGQSEYLNRNK